MVSELVIYLDDELCGYIEQSSSGNLAFAYADAYRVKSDATPLSLSMPLAAARYRKKEILPFLQGLLPDSEFALRAMARRFRVSPNNAFALLEHMGADVAGALQIFPAGQQATDGASDSDLRFVEADEVVHMLRAVIAEYESGNDVAGSIGHFSLAGAQPKIALHKKDERWAVPGGRTPTTHILKPVTGALRRIDVVEHLTMTAARALGLNVARSELTSVGDIDVFVTERYDRVVRDGIYHRLHQEDFCQALSVTPAKKYQRGDGGPGVAHIAKLISSLRNESDRTDVGLSFFKGLVFNVIAGCTDAHAKNYSLILQAQRVQLAPLYDLSSYAAYWNGNSAIASAMSIAGEFALDRISSEMLISQGQLLGLADEARDIVDHTRTSVRLAFDRARDELVATNPDARRIADELIRNVAMLPLVL